MTSKGKDSKAAVGRSGGATATASAATGRRAPKGAAAAVAPPAGPTGPAPKPRGKRTRRGDVEPVTPRKPGRQLKLTPETRTRIVQAIGVGAPMYQAAALGGCSYWSLKTWLDRGEQEQVRLDEADRAEESSEADRAVIPSEEPYLRLYQELKAAEAAAVTRWLGRIEQAASDGAWQAAAWKLERRHPADFGRPMKVEVAGPEGGPVPIAIVGLPIDDL